MRKRLMTLGLLWALLPGLAVHTAAAEAPDISAASAVLLDGESGRILYAKGQNDKRAIASITKLMTALVAAEYIDDLSQEITIRKDWTGIEGTSLYLEPGEKITLEALLYGLLLHSGNDAAVALAAHCAGDVETFVGWMNQRARDLNMTGTHFSDPNGLGDENHYSTALDMAKLGAACLKNETVAKIVATKSITLGTRTFTNHNKLLWRYEGCTGMKTGYTRQAGRTLVSSAEREGQTLICVTLNDRDDWRDHQALLDFGFSAFPRRVLAERGQSLGRVAVTGSLLTHVSAQARETVAYPLKEEEEITVRIDLPRQAEAPVRQGEIAGQATFFLGERQVGRTYLVWGLTASRDVLSPDSPHSPFGFLKKLAGG